MQHEWIERETLEKRMTESDIYVPIFHEELFDYFPRHEILDVDGELLGQLVRHQGHPAQRDDGGQVVISLLRVQILLQEGGKSASEERGESTSALMTEGERDAP